MDNIVRAMATAAESYFADDSITDAVPPLRALLHIMRDGHWEGSTAAAPAVRGLFSREAMLGSDWYRARLRSQQVRDIAHWEQRAAYLEDFLARPNYSDVAARLNVQAKLVCAQAAAAAARDKDYLSKLHGTLGVDPTLVRALA
jgi:hypothetical protein